MGDATDCDSWHRGAPPSSPSRFVMHSCIMHIMVGPPAAARTVTAWSRPRAGWINEEPEQLPTPRLQCTRAACRQFCTSSQSVAVKGGGSEAWQVLQAARAAQYWLSAYYPTRCPLHGKSSRNPGEAALVKLERQCARLPRAGAHFPSTVQPTTSASRLEALRWGGGLGSDFSVLPGVPCEQFPSRRSVLLERERFCVVSVQHATGSRN